MDIKKLLLTSGVLLTLDAIFLNFTKSIFNKMVKNIQGSDIKINLLMLPLVYITVTLQIYYFIINKNASVFEAFLLGFLTYSIFDLTNYIIFKKYDIKVAILDVIWGGTLYALTTYIVRQF